MGHRRLCRRRLGNPGGGRCHAGVSRRAATAWLRRCHCPARTTLRNKLLTPDGLWLVQKGKDGTSKLRRVSEAKGAKKAGNKLEEAYVKGKLGGVPPGKRLFVPAPIRRGERGGIVLVDEKTFRKLEKKGKKAKKAAA